MSSIYAINNIAYIPSLSSQYQAPSIPSIQYKSDVPIISPIDHISFLPNKNITQHNTKQTYWQRTSSVYTSNQRKKTHHRDPTITQRELYTDERLRCRKHLMPQILGNFAPNHSEQTSWPRRFGVGWEIYPCCNHLSLEHALWCSPVMGHYWQLFCRCWCCFRKKNLITRRKKTSPSVKTSRTWQERQRVFWGHLIKPVISFIHEVYWIGER